MMHQIWHVERRIGFWYATNQFRRFTQHNSEEEAKAAIEATIKRYGDTWQEVATD